MPKKQEDLKSVMIACYKCGWSFSSRKDACPMCGADIVLNKKELIRILGEYIERQGLWSSKKECEKFIKKFKKANKRTPSLDELWNASIDFAKLQKMDKEQIKKMKAKQDLDLKAQMDKLKQKKLMEKQKKKQLKQLKKDDVEEPKQKVSVGSNSDSENRLEQLRKRRQMAAPTTASTSVKSTSSSGSNKPPMAPKSKDVNKKADSEYVICPTCGTKNPKNSKFCLEDGTPL